MNEIEALMCLLIAGVFSVESTMASSLQCLGRLQVVLLTFTLLGFAGVATADRIHLKHGDYIDVDSWREEGDRIPINASAARLACPSPTFYASNAERRIRRSGKPQARPRIRRLARHHRPIRR